MTLTDAAPIAVGEAIEGAFLGAIAENAPAVLREALGLRVVAVDGVTVLTVRAGIPMFNRAVGFGTPVTAGLLDRILDVYREAGVPGAALKIPVPLLPGDWAQVCAARGLTPLPDSVKVTRSTADQPPARTDLRVGRVPAAEERAWIDLVMSGLEPVPYLADLMPGPGRDPRGSRFAAWDGDEMVAAAQLFTHGRAGVLKSGMTRASHRGRGAQSALITARIAAARNAGCDWVVSETSAPEPGERHTSLGNLERLGFARIYDYRTVRWEKRG
ncbi:GNAT superfamily N-acetyltransferase [Catenuloplanes nepalensis]|uniref:GNAT superfamily N-acetyltransferase n=1 Tax=Catenuloplanes nepalensis TaxID=587533 RepID=A0ABT9MPH4_9ACTN|nr:GNAT family N-acetyltransferase [Catenuloplanes nepalensis]MDP9793307.1 GNAT superfamily N-acetyltransferase [Catenuloplanes nepalensis]